MFKITNTWKSVTTPENQQRGFPAPGTGQQRVSNSRLPPKEGAWIAQSGVAGSDSWDDPSDPVDAQRGFPAPEGIEQAYAPGDLTHPTPDGNQYYRVTRQFSRGAQRSAPITGTVLASPNPGVPIPCKPSVVPKYPLGIYINNEIFWANQTIPKTIPLQGLQTQKAIAALLATWDVYGTANVGTGVVAPSEVFGYA